MKKFILKMKYPKFFLMFLTFLLACFIFIGRDYEPFYKFLTSLGYIGTFIAGTFFSYGFTSAPAIAVLLILAKGQNMLIAGFTAGFGALIGDLIIYKFIKSLFSDEIRKLSKEKVVGYINGKIKKTLKMYIIPILAGFILASPLPDEIGVFLLASLKHIPIRTFIVLSLVFKTIGVFIILTIGKAI